MGTWSDENGDGRRQPEKWHVTNRPAYPVGAGGPQQGWGAYFDENFNLYMHDWSDDKAGGVWKIPVAQWTAGAPVYRWESASTWACRGPTALRTEPAARGPPSSIKAASTPSMAVTMRPDCPASAMVTTGSSPRSPAMIPTPAGRCGKPGERAAGFIAPGQHYCPTGPAGALDGYLFWTDENSLVHVWDLEHGLYVDTLLDDCSRGPIPSPCTVWVELFNSRVFRHPKTGKVYLLAASDAIHVFEVLGTRQKPLRFQGEFTLTEADLQSAPTTRGWRTAPRERTLVIRRASGPVTIDGDLSEFAHCAGRCHGPAPSRPGYRPTDV